MLPGLWAIHTAGRCSTMELSEAALLVAGATRNFQKQDFPGAEQQLREVLEHFPDNPDALYLLGTINARAGRFPEAGACSRMRRLNGRNISY